MKRCDPTYWLVLWLCSAASPALAIDGQPSFDSDSDNGVYVWRTWHGEWQMRVMAAAGNQRVDGLFQTALPATYACARAPISLFTSDGMQRRPPHRST